MTTSTTTCTWMVEWMQAKKVEGDLTDVVIQAGWRANGIATVDSSTYQATVYGSVGFQTPDPAQFTPYTDLSKEQVLEWIWQNGVDKAATEANLENQINYLINPPIVQLPLPWTNS